MQLFLLALYIYIYIERERERERKREKMVDLVNSKRCKKIRGKVDKSKHVAKSANSKGIFIELIPLKGFN